MRVQIGTMLIFVIIFKIYLGFVSVYFLLLIINLTINNMINNAPKLINIQFDFDKEGNTSEKPSKVGCKLG